MSVKHKIYLKIFTKALILLLTAIAFFGIHFYYKEFLQTASKGIYAIPFLAVLYIIIVFKSKFFKILLDKNWEGEVKAVETKIGAEPITFWVAIGRQPPKEIPYTVVTVIKDDSTTIKLTFQSSKIAPSAFHIGTKIKHYKGTTYPILSNFETLGVCFCPICGRTLTRFQCPDCKIKF